MDKIEIYIDELLEKSTPDRPIWNIEKILQGLKSRNIFALPTTLSTARSERTDRLRAIR